MKSQTDKIREELRKRETIRRRLRRLLSDLHMQRDVLQSFDRWLTAYVAGAPAVLAGLPEQSLEARAGIANDTRRGISLRLSSLQYVIRWTQVRLRSEGQRVARLKRRLHDQADRWRC